MPRSKPLIKPLEVLTVRSLIKSVTALGNALKLTPNAIYRWIKVNRIPVPHLTAVANFYDVELGDILHLGGSEGTYVSKPLHKPHNTLQELVKVHDGKQTLAAAVSTTGVSERSLRLVLFHWGDQLPNLYKTMEQLAKEEISLETACLQLGVTKYTVHGLRKKYGYAPGKVPITVTGLARKQTKLENANKRVAQRDKALDVIAGRLTAKQAAKELGISYRTMFRVLDKVSDFKIQDLTAWPKVFQAALAREIDQNSTQYAQKWLDFVNKQRLFISKAMKYPKTPPKWKGLPLKRLLVGLLLGEATLDEIAVSRGADPKILRGLFTGDLRPLGITYNELLALSIEHQTAVVTILLASLDRRRKLLA